MRLSHRTNGQSMVEFALIVPLLLMLMFGIIELGLMFSVYIGLSNSAREGARAGSVYQYTGTPFTNSTPLNTATTTVDNERLTYLSQVITDTINPMVDPTTQLTQTVSYSPATPITPYRTADTVTVQLEHDHPLFFGLFGDQKITIRATSAMRIEPGATK